MSAAEVRTGESWRDLGVSAPYGSYGEIRTQCPACSHTRHKTYEKCLAANMDKGTGRCHHCDTRFHVKENLEYRNPTPIRAVRRRKGFRPEYRAGDPEYSPMTETVRGWLQRERAIPPEVSAAAHIEGRVEWMYAREKGQQGGDTRVIAFPYYRDEEVINLKLRTLDKRFRMVKDADLCLYGLNDIAEDELIWTEGEIDKLSFAAIGLASCVSVPNGAPPPNVRDYDGQFDYLEDDIEAIMAVKRHIIAVDNDDPGRRLAHELARRLDPDRCLLVTWIKGCKDANDVLVRHGPEALRGCYERAKPFPVIGVFDGDEEEILGDLDQLWEYGYNGGVAPGDDKLGEFYRILPGLWTLVTGAPSSGKSEILNWLAVNLMREQDWRFAICSPENQPIARHIAQLAQIYVGKPFNRGPHDRMTEAERDDALAFVREHATFILPPEDEAGSYSLDNILSLCRRAIVRKGVRGIIIDPWNELEHNRPSSMREDEYISRCLVKIKRFAREHMVHIWLVAHPRTMVRRKDGDGYEVPTLNDVSGGHQWRSQAMMGIVVHRKKLGDPTTPTTIYVQKVKRRELGKIGEIDLWYDAATGRYSSQGPVERRYERKVAPEETAPTRASARRKPVQAALIDEAEADD